MYNDKVLNEFKKPSNMGAVKNANAVGTVGNATCGDIMEMSMKIVDNVIKEVKFKTFGCTAAIATSSVATRLVKGKTIEEALKITNRQVIEELGELPPQKLHCSVLAEEAIREAINNYLTNMKKQGRTESELES